MKIDHLFQALITEIAFQEVTLNAMTAFIQKKLNVSFDEVETFVDQYGKENGSQYVLSVKRRMEKNIAELEAAS